MKKKTIQRKAAKKKAVPVTKTGATGAKKSGRAISTPHSELDLQFEDEPISSSGGGGGSGNSQAAERSTGDDDDDLIPLKLMYSDYFLDYASYVILERAVPHVNDGLKPVQRRIMHAMFQMEDGRYNKVANIMGDTMKYHPHGDAAIKDAIVNLGQKELLIDTQGNWGNILTGDPAAAERYIEARLAKFALDVVFNPKTTEWSRSYDGRRNEPVTLPVKFPLLLAQGAEGIAVGLACKILPHNFNELIDACIACLKRQEFTLLPDFMTGGIMDAENYNDGLRGGNVRVRAQIELPKRNRSLLVIREVPFGVTTTKLIESILSANEKGKIKVAKVDDTTSERVEIAVHLPSGTNRDAMLQALYAFTDCEVSISPNACVIKENRPQFIGVQELLKHAAKQTRELLKLELEIRLGELNEKWHFSSLEKIFIEKRIYRDIEECTTWEAVMKAIWSGLKPYLKLFKRAVTDEDVARLTEIRIKRISKYNSFKADDEIKALENDIKEVERQLKRLTPYTVKYFEELKKKYGKGRERRTEISTFDKVQASDAAVATETLYLDQETGFVGYGLKRGAQALGKCSRLDSVIVFSEDGTFRVSKVTDRAFFGKPLHVAVFRKEEAPVYTMIYRDGRGGRIYVKRFQVSGVTRDKVYDLTKGTKGTKVLYFQVSSSAKEADELAVTVHLKPALRLRNVQIDLEFKSIGIKGRGSKGNIITQHTVQRISRKK
jgi:topoisomerase-4 subunit A